MHLFSSHFSSTLRYGVAFGNIISQIDVVSFKSFSLELDLLPHSFCIFKLGYEFDKASLMEYNPMSFGGSPVTLEIVEEADDLLCNDEKESTIEMEVLAAPPKLVYKKLILRFAKNLLVVVMDKWDIHVIVINKVAPPNWKVTTCKYEFHTRR